MISGSSVKLGDTEYVVPPLNFAGLKKCQSAFSTINAMKGIPTIKDVEAVKEVLMCAILRNYPDFLPTILDEYVDVISMAEILSIVLGQSGLKKTMTTATENPSNGTNSTPISSPSPDGVGNISITA